MPSEDECRQCRRGCMGARTRRDTTRTFDTVSWQEQILMGEFNERGLRRSEKEVSGGQGSSSRERGCKDDVAIIGASSGAMRPNARLVVVIPPGTWAGWNMTRRPKPEKPLHQLHLLLICSHWCEPHIPGSLATQRCSQ